METDRVTLNVDFDLTSALKIRYTYGGAETHTLSSFDTDFSSRVSSSDDVSRPSDVDPDDPRWEDWMGFGDDEMLHFFDNDESSHEFQLISSFDGPFNFIVGAYLYENETTWQHAMKGYANSWRFSNADEVAGELGYDDCPALLVDWEMGDDYMCLPGADHTDIFHFFSSTKSETVALFVNAEYALSDKWRLAAGIRWTEDEKTEIARIPPFASKYFPEGLGDTDTPPSGFYSFSLLGVPVAYLFGGELNPIEPWDAVIAQASLEYLLGDNQMIYGRISTGYRAGGLNWARSAPPAYNEESLINYEVGVKGWFLENRLQLMSGLFFADYKDFQIQGEYLIPPELLFPDDDWPYEEYTANVDTDIWGAEVQALYYVTERLRLSGYYTYLDSKIGPNAFLIEADPDAEPFVHEFIDFESGETEQYELPLPHENTDAQLPQQPKHKAALSAAYTLPLEQLGSLDFLVTVSYTGERWPGVGEVEFTRIPDYSRWDFRAAWSSPSEHWGATFFVQNVFDQFGVSGLISGDFIGSLTPPRKIGLQIRWKM